MPETCGRINATDDCPKCTAAEGEGCPYEDLTAGLLESRPISAGKAAGVPCEGGEVCESCQ